MPLRTAALNIPNRSIISADQKKKINNVGVAGETVGCQSAAETSALGWGDSDRLLRLDVQLIVVLPQGVSTRKRFTAADFDAFKWHSPV
jgi:hypothetical protein